MGLIRGYMTRGYRRARNRRLNATAGPGIPSVNAPGARGLAACISDRFRLRLTKGYGRNCA